MDLSWSHLFIFHVSQTPGISNGCLDFLYSLYVNCEGSYTGVVLDALQPGKPNHPRCLTIPLHVTLHQFPQIFFFPSNVAK